ncbi:hypothetical protein [Ahrensia sp. R2A130]|nr:hypothetical protein [Ahrensia sp. R2A130]EFL89633.1 cytochrome c oxidase subunit I [Ahrensia sp. R2A130]
MIWIALVFAIIAGFAHWRGYPKPALVAAGMAALTALISTITLFVA